VSLPGEHAGNRLRRQRHAAEGAGLGHALLAGRIDGDQPIGLRRQRALAVAGYCQHPAPVPCAEQPHSAQSLGRLPGAGDGYQQRIHIGVKTGLGEKGKLGGGVGVGRDAGLAS